MSDTERLGLKPCPHCASKRLSVLERTSWVEIHCLSCGSKGPSASSEAIAAKRWNWRLRINRAESKS